MPNVSSFQLPQELLIVGAAANMGIFEAVRNKPSNVGELAEYLQVDYRALWVVVEALVALEYFEYEGDKIKLTPEANSILFDEENENYTGFSFMHTYNLLSSWIQLPEIIKTGKPASKKKDPGQSRDFIRAMSKFAEDSAPKIAEYCLKDLPGNPKVLDVGGGPLTYALAFAESGAEVTVLDTPEVIDMMQPELDSGVPVKMVKGDFTEGLPVQGPFDLIYLGNVCHIYGEKENRKLFQDSASMLKPGGRLIINDIIRGAGARPALFGVNMLVNTSSGGTWTFEQYKDWLEGAGFSVSPYVEVAGRQLIPAFLSK